MYSKNSKKGFVPGGEGKLISKFICKDGRIEKGTKITIKGLWSKGILTVHDGKEIPIPFKFLKPLGKIKKESLIDFSFDLIKKGLAIFLNSPYQIGDTNDNRLSLSEGNQLIHFVSCEGSYNYNTLPNAYLSLLQRSTHYQKEGIKVMEFDLRNVTTSDRDKLIDLNRSVINHLPSGDYSTYFTATQKDLLAFIGCSFHNNSRLRLNFNNRAAIASLVVLGDAVTTVENQIIIDFRNLAFFQLALVREVTKVMGYNPVLHNIVNESRYVPPRPPWETGVSYYTADEIPIYNPNGELPNRMPSGGIMNQIIEASPNQSYYQQYSRETLEQTLNELREMQNRTTNSDE